MLWCESSKDCILLGLIDSDRYLRKFGKLVHNKCERFHHEPNSGALHATFWLKQSLLEHCVAAVSEFIGHLALQWGYSVCVNILRKWHRRPPAHHKWGPEGMMRAERAGDFRHPEVDRWNTDPLFLTSYTITCLRRVCVKRFNLIHVGCRSALDSQEMLGGTRQRYSHFADRRHHHQSVLDSLNV